MKLYRGLKEAEIKFFELENKESTIQTMKALLEMRHQGDFKYPEDMNKEVIRAHKNLRLKDQYFTDQKDIAEKYSKEVKGSLLEIDVPVEEILENFKVEFQDFGKRKFDFRLVYRVDGELLCKKRQDWGLKHHKPEGSNL